MNESKLDVKKRAVIEIAENLFLSQGLATTEMKEIARCASISRSTLYRMFDSRETLAFAVADKCLHELFDPKPMEIYGTDRSGFEILRSYSSNLIETMIQGVRYVKYLSEFDQMFSHLRAHNSPIRIPVSRANKIPNLHSSNSSKR